MYGRANMVVMRGFRMDPSITRQKLKPGTIRRIAAYARPYRMHLAVFLLATAVDAVITVVNPLLLRDIIDHGILGRDEQLVILLACAVALLGLVGAVVGMRRWGGPSQRYEVPDGSTPEAAGPRGERVASDWDELSAGRDPTDVGPDAPT